MLAKGAIDQQEVTDQLIGIRCGLGECRGFSYRRPARIDRQELKLDEVLRRRCSESALTVMMRLVFYCGGRDLIPAVEVIEFMGPDYAVATLQEGGCRRMRISMGREVLERPIGCVVSVVVATFRASLCGGES
jgi:hypothetical protein